MRRVDGPQTPYEVYCFQCHVTFPAEARRCVHCGQRLSARGAETSLASEAPTLSELLERPGGASAEEEADESVLTLRRFGVPAVWALIALSAILSNLCEGR